MGNPVRREGGRREGLQLEELKWLAGQRPTILLLPQVMVFASQTTHSQSW